VIDAERRETSDGALAPGTRVEVRNRFEGRWSRGFEVAEAVTGGYVVRRVSDAEILPVRFDEDDVRAERRRQGLWWA
jgi:hypothetical protein